MAGRRKKRGGKRRGSHRRVKRGGGSSAGCAKTVDKCGMSASVCDDSHIREALREARQGQRNVHQWAKAIAKEESQAAGQRIKSLTKQLTDFTRAKNDSLKSCRKTISVAQHMQAANRAGQHSYLNAFRRRTRRAR